MTDSLLDIWGMRKRAARDSARHQKRIRKAIKENLRDLIGDSSIISSDGKKKIKIPIRFLDSYRFKHSENKNQENVGQGNASGKPGDIIAHDGTGIKKDSGQPDNQEGEEIYEEEVELDEIVKMMLEDLGLPWLEAKENSVEIETENLKFTDIAEIGPLSNIDKKRTILENIKRNAKLGKPKVNKIIPADLRYKIWDIEKEHHSNASVYCLMDRSGSMDTEKKYLARSFFFWLVHFCKTKYTNVELVFIAHDTSAKIVPEENFFKISNSGGTMCSSALKLALEHITANHPKDLWNNYVFHFSDGDNFASDNETCVKLVEKLLEVSAAIGYGEIKLNKEYGSWSTLHDEFSKEIKNEKFITAEIAEKEDIYKCLKQFLGIKNQ
jgi:sporulation protein YhbH